MAGTNNVGNGEKPQNVLNKIKGFVATVQKKCPAAQVVVAGLVHREDKPHLNKSIDVINSVLSRKRSGSSSKSLLYVTFRHKRSFK